MKKFFPGDWKLAEVLLFGLTLSIAMSAGAQVYGRFLSPVVRQMLGG